MNFRQKAGGWVRWTARIAGGLILGLFLVFATGEGLHGYFGDSPVEIVAGVGAIAMLVGVGLSYWKIFWGCVLIVTGYAGFAICEQDLLLDTPFFVFPVIVILYATAWLLEHNGSTVKHPD